MYKYFMSHCFSDYQYLYLYPYFYLFPVLQSVGSESMLTSSYYLQWIAVISKHPRLVCEVLLGNGRTVFFVSFLISLLHGKVGWNWVDVI